MQGALAELRAPVTVTTREPFAETTACSPIAPTPPNQGDVMNTVDVATIPARRAPLPDGPTVRTLLGSNIGLPVAVLHVSLPADGRLPEHAHGPSHIVLIPLHGHVWLRHEGNDHDLGPGTATHIDIGERVSLANSGPEPAELLVVATPPDFADTLSVWPTA